MKILGIESSCDETAVAVIEDGTIMLSNTVASSMDIHAKFGGVIPEIASRCQIEAIIPTIETSLSTAETSWAEIDAIAVTYGAGLSGSLLIGVLTARTLAIIKNKPLIAINHVQAHVYANFLTSTPLNRYVLRESPPLFPVLALIVSGGHTQLVLFKNHSDHQIIGRTQDDAIGEAFDKVAKIIGMPYPGGPSIAKLAEKGNAETYNLPKAKMTNRYDFSFSGLKTAVLRLAQEQIGEDYNFPSKNVAGRLSEPQKANIAASFQRIAIETVVDKTIQAFEEFKPASVVIAGGVAANRELRDQLSSRLPIQIEYTDTKLCTDNGAMVGALGYFQSANQPNGADAYSLHIQPGLSMERRSANP
jgi:N6-L-threonylcarbamoyladenine synthase